MSNKDAGILHKYNVERVDGKPIKGGQCFVLEVGDPIAIPALGVWAETLRLAGYKQLSDEIFALLPEHIPDELSALLPEKEDVLPEDV